MKKTPAPWREQLDDIGRKLTSGDRKTSDRIVAADQLERWVFKNCNHLAHAIVREWVRDRLDDWLRARLREQADTRVRPKAQEGLFDLLDQMPERIEIAVGKMIDRLDARRPQIIAWKKQAQVKADNVLGFKSQVDACANYLLAQMTDDDTTVREVLQRIPMNADSL